MPKEKTNSTFLWFRRRKRRRKKNEKPSPLPLPDRYKESMKDSPLLKEINEKSPQVKEKIADLMRLNAATRAENWKRIPKLATPIQTTPDDVVMYGHGATSFEPEIPVPEGFEFVMLAPPGNLLRYYVATALTAGEEITKLGLESPITGELMPVQPRVYKAGDMVPNLALWPPGDLPRRSGPNSPKAIEVTENEEIQLLDELFVKAEVHRQPGKTVRIFWTACTEMDETGGPNVEMERK